MPCTYVCPPSASMPSLANRRRESNSTEDISSWLRISNFMPGLTYSQTVNPKIQSKEQFDELKFIKFLVHEQKLTTAFALNEVYNFLPLFFCLFTLCTLLYSYGPNLRSCTGHFSSHKTYIWVNNTHHFIQIETTWKID